MKKIIIASVIVAIAIVFVAIKYGNIRNNSSSDLALTPNNLSTVDDCTTEKIIRSKLRIYDIIDSKKASEIRSTTLDFLNYALLERKSELLTAADKKFVNEEIQLIQMKEKDVKNMSDNDLVDAWYSSYKMQYGTRTNLEKELQQSNFRYKNDSHILITLPQRSNGYDIEIRTMDAYLINGEWR